MLQHRYHGRHNLVLDSKAPVSRARRRIVVLDGCQARREGLAGRLPRQNTGVGVREVYARGGRLVGEGRVQSSIIDIVALNALIEYASPTAKNGLSVPEDVIDKAQARLPGEVPVFNVATREAAHARFLDSVEIKLLAAGGRERGKQCRVEGAVRLHGVGRRKVVTPRHEIGKLVVPLECVRQSVETESNVQRQPRSDVPIVDSVAAVVVVDPVLARQVLQLSVA